MFTRKKIKWGILGVGLLSDERIAPGISISENSELVAISLSRQSTSTQKLEDFAKRHNVPRWYTDIDKFLADPEIDVVYVCVPNAYHCEFVKKVASAGKHVFCEKPMAISLDECQQMIDACEKAKVKLGLAFMLPFHPGAIHSRQIIRSGELGDVRLIRSNIMFRIPPVEQINPWRLDPKISGGGPIIEVGSHCVDIMDFLIESPVVEVSAMADKDRWSGTSEELGTILLRYANEAIGIITVASILPCAGEYGACYDVHGTKASLVGVGNLMRDPTGYILLQRENGTNQKFIYSGHMATLWAGEVTEFSRCIIEGDQPRTDGNHGMHNIRILLAAYESVSSGKTIKIGG